MKNILIDLMRHDVRFEAYRMALRHVPAGERERFRRLHRLEALLMGALLRGDEEWSWKLLHEKDHLCPDDYVLFRDKLEAHVPREYLDKMAAHCERADRIGRKNVADAGLEPMSLFE